MSPKEHRISPSISASGHLNGTSKYLKFSLVCIINRHILVANLVSFQNLQNLASYQHNLPQTTSLASGIQTLAAGLSATSPIANAPLNLSVNSTCKTIKELY